MNKFEQVSSEHTHHQITGGGVVPMSDVQGGPRSDAEECPTM